MAAIAVIIRGARRGVAEFTTEAAPYCEFGAAEHIVRSASRASDDDVAYEREQGKNARSLL
jgi:hypothetical protein